MMFFMLPILGALILQAMYGAVDLLIVGRFGSEAGISAISTGSSIMNMIIFVQSQLAAGVMILIGRFLGEGEPEKISKLVGRAVMFFLAFAIVLTVILMLFAKQIALLMQAPEEAVDLTASYIIICGGGCVFIVFYNLISCIFRGLGNSRLPLLFVGIACVANVALDLLFVAVFNMDVAGAAIATIMAQAVSVILSLLIIRRQKLPFTLKKADLRLDGEIAEFVKIGTPLALQEFLTSITFLAICAFINGMGLAESNGYGIAQKIQSFIMLIPGALIMCMASFVAQNVGACKESRARLGTYYGMAFGAGIGTIIAVSVFFFGDVIASVFSTNPTDIGKAFEYLRGSSLEAVLTCILFSFMGYFNGHARSTFVMIQSIACAMLVRLPLSYLASHIEGANLTLVGFAVPISTVVGILICLIYYIYITKKQDRALKLG